MKQNVGVPNESFQFITCRNSLRRGSSRTKPGASPSLLQLQKLTLGYTVIVPQSHSILFSHTTDFPLHFCLTVLSALPLCSTFSPTTLHRGQLTRLLLRSDKERYQHTSQMREPAPAPGTTHFSSTSPKHSSANDDSCYHSLNAFTLGWFVFPEQNTN